MRITEHAVRAAAAVLAVSLAGCAGPGPGPGPGPGADAVSPPPGAVMTQDQFPCTEDEVLGHAPRFGPEHVGCIHRDMLGGAR